MMLSSKSQSSISSELKTHGAHLPSFLPPPRPPSSSALSITTHTPRREPNMNTPFLTFRSFPPSEIIVFSPSPFMLTCLLPICSSVALQQNRSSTEDQLTIYLTTQTYNYFSLHKQNLLASLLLLS